MKICVRHGYTLVICEGVLLLCESQRTCSVSDALRFAFHWLHKYRG